MTNMIYRGTKHDRQPATELRIARDLIYRGAAHDGRPTASRAHRAEAGMCYRGARYVVEAGGAIAGLASVHVSEGFASAAAQGA